MPTKRSEEDLLQRLDSLHMRGGKHAFVTDLADIRASDIKCLHRQITKSIVNDARGLGMALDHPKVLAARQHVVREYLRSKRTSINPIDAQPNGFALAR